MFTRSSNQYLIRYNANLSLSSTKGCRSVNKQFDTDSFLDWEGHPLGSHTFSHPNTDTLSSPQQRVWFDICMATLYAIESFEPQYKRLKRVFTCSITNKNHFFHPNLSNKDILSIISYDRVNLSSTHVLHKNRWERPIYMNKFIW